MRRILLLPAAMLVTLVVAASAGADTKTVQVTRSGFTPSAVTVTVGDSVTWHNADTVSHQVVANDGSFASPVLKADETYTFTFQKAGRFAYHDSFVTTNRGTVTVNAPAANVTLAAAARTVTYGNSTTVSGMVTNQLANETVTLTSQPFGRTEQSIATATTQANGAFSFTVSPTIETAYQAHWRSTSSGTVTVGVSPRVGFGRIGRLYVAKVTSDLSYGGKYVLAQRRNALGTWSTLRRVYLGVNSRAVFRLHLVRGRSVLRLAMPASQAGAGYVLGLSRLIVVPR